MTSGGKKEEIWFRNVHPFATRLQHPDNIGPSEVVAREIKRIEHSHATASSRVTFLKERTLTARASDPSQVGFRNLARSVFSSCAPIGTGWSQPRNLHGLDSKQFHGDVAKSGRSLSAEHTCASDQSHS